MEKELSTRQKQILDYVKQFTSKKGYPPSVREIGKAVGLSSSSTVHAHLHTLESKGLLKRDPAKPRALEISGFEAHTNNVSVPIVGRVAAGAPILAEENIDSYFSLPQEFVGSGDVSFMLEVKGDSMINAGIFEGDYIVIKRQATANNGDIVVAMVGDEEATVKRFYREQNAIRLQPENPSLAPIYSRDVKLIGKVVAVLRKL